MDRDIADRMQNDNFEQFQTLVRMHLSFELDLNTDAVEWVSIYLCFFLFEFIDKIWTNKFFSKKFELFTYDSCAIFLSNDGVSNTKVRSKKLFAFPRKSKQLHTSHKNPPFNIVNTLTFVGIEQIKKMINFLVQNQSKY